MISMTATEFRRRISEIEKLVAIGEVIAVTRHKKVVFIIKAENEVDVDKLAVKDEPKEPEECHCTECEEPFEPNNYEIPMEDAVLAGTVDVYDERDILIEKAPNYRKILNQGSLVKAINDPSKES